MAGGAGAESKHAATMGVFDSRIAAIVELDWYAEGVSYEEKVSEFFRRLEELLALLNHDRWLRTGGFWVLVFMFYRLVVYMKVQNCVNYSIQS